MKHFVLVLSVVIAAAAAVAAGSQDRREQGSYAEMRAYLGELFEQKKYAEAAAMLERVLDRFPDNVRANTFNLAVARLFMGQPDRAIDALEDGLRRGVFYGRWDFDAEVLAPLRQHPRFAAFFEANEERLAEADKKAVMKLEVTTPPGYDASRRYPLFLALHGGGENIAVFKPNWASPGLQATFIIAWVQSSQVSGMSGFHWQDEARTRRDLEAAYEEVTAGYRVDRDRVIVGGFSSGGFASLVTAFHQTLPVRGFVALCPEVPTSITDADITAAAGRGLRGSLLTTEHDHRVEAQRTFAGRWKALGLDGEFVLTPDVGHWYPKDFAQQLDRAIARILGESGTVKESAATQGSRVSFASNGQSFNDLVGRGVVLADFNGDAALDAFVANESASDGQDCRVYFGNGHGKFSDSGQRLTSALPARRPNVYDIDGNGAVDVIVGRAAWMNDGRGRFAASDSPLVDAGGGTVWQCRLTDLDGDGVTDLLALVTGAGMESVVRVYLNDRKGHFREAGQMAMPGVSAFVELGDLNGDGALDAVVSGWRNATADLCPNRVLLNDGKGHFTDTAQQLDEQMRHSHGLALGDVDGDGDLDVVIVTQGTPSARLYLNDGKGRFTAGRALGTSSVEKVALADFDGDGSLDLFLACLGPDEVWLNDGHGTFTDSSLRLGKEWSWELAVGDLNGDRRPDVVVVNLGVDRNAPPDKMMLTRPAEVWLNTTPPPLARPKNPNPGEIDPVESMRAE